MARNAVKNPGRLGPILLLFLLLAAGLTAIALSSSSDSEHQSADDTLASGAATPEIETLNDGSATGGDGSGPGSGADPGSSPPGGAPGAGGPALIAIQTGNGGAPGGTPMPEPAPDPGTITGLVLSEASNPLKGITVTLFRPDGSPAGPSTTTAADGSFRFVLAPGSYKLFFSDPAGAYDPAWYGGYGPGSATPVAVTSNQQTAVTQTLTGGSNGGAIAGTVREDGGGALKGVYIFAFLYVEFACPAGTCDTLELKGMSTTDATGKYTVSGLQAGSYKVLFNPFGGKLTIQWYREQSTHETAKTVAVETGKTTAGIDADLYTGGTLSGVITRQGGQPASSALVDVYDEAGVIVYSGLTGSDGSYRSSQLPDGNYRVHAATNISGTWTDEWYNDKSDFASADPIKVTRGTERGGVDIEINGKKAPIIIAGQPAVDAPEENGVVAGSRAPGDAGAPAGEETGPEGDDPSGGDGHADEGPDGLLPAVEEEQDVIGDDGYDEGAVSQVDSDVAPVA